MVRPLDGCLLHVSLLMPSCSQHLLLYNATISAEARQVPELLAEQVEAADVVIMNKVDLSKGEQLTTATIVVKSLNEKAELIETQFGEITPDKLLGTLGKEKVEDRGHSHSHQHGEHDEECTQTDCTDSSHSHDHSHSADSSCHDPHCDDTTHSHDSTSEHSSCSDPDCSDSSHTHEHSHDHSSECSDAGKIYRA